MAGATRPGSSEQQVGLPPATTVGDGALGVGAGRQQPSVERAYAGSSRPCATINVRCGIRCNQGHEGEGGDHDRLADEQRERVSSSSVSVMQSRTHLLTAWSQPVRPARDERDDSFGCRQAVVMAAQHQCEHRGVGPAAGAPGTGASRNIKR